MNDLTLIADKWRPKIWLATSEEKMDQLFPAQNKAQHSMADFRWNKSEVQMKNRLKMQEGAYFW